MVIAPLLLATNLAFLTVGDGAAPPGATRCDADQAGNLVGAPARQLQVACLRLDDGLRVIAAVPMLPTAGAPLVVHMALARGDTVTWHDDVRVVADGHAELRNVLDKSEEWLADVESQPLAGAPGVRVGVVGHWGVDPMSSREVALLFRLAGDGRSLKLLWSGLGNTRDSRLDYCLIEGIATFRLVDDHTLERELRLTPVINRDAPVPRRRARALEKGCVAKTPPVERFTITP